MTILSNSKYKADHLALASLLRRLWLQLSVRRQRQFFWLFGLMLLSAIAEIISLGAVMPFLAVLSSPGRALEIAGVAALAQFLNIVEPRDLMLPFSILFATAAVMAGGVRLLVLWGSIRLAFNTGSDLSMDAYRRTLYQPYSVHVARNSSEVIDSLNAKISGAVGVLQQLLLFASSIVLLVFVMLALLSINAEVAATAAFGFGAAYILISRFYRKKLAHNSQLTARHGPMKMKAMHEGLGGIRDVLLDGTQEFYCNIYRHADSPLRMAVGNNSFIAMSPRNVMESIGMALIAGLAYLSFRQQDGPSSALIVLGTVALGAQRILPALQAAYASWVGITANRHSLFDALELLNQPLSVEDLQPAPMPLQFKNSIRFDNVQFRYASEGPWILDGIELNIPKGARVGFVGGTGSGKSTVLDLMMGLMEPTEGRVLVDELPINGVRLRAWRRIIAHVPQSIYLADTSLAENIAFGLAPEKIDMVRVRQVARQARIADFIESNPNGYDVVVGERGVRLSGGQRQRIGIARALYKQATVLVFDEATSALDNTTEQEVMDAIEGLGGDLTIIVVAHRLTTVKRCDFIVEVAHGKVVAQGTYEYLLKFSPSFHGMANA